MTPENQSLFMVKQRSNLLEFSQAIQNIPRQMLQNISLKNQKQTNKHNKQKHNLTNFWITWAS